MTGDEREFTYGHAYRWARCQSRDSDVWEAYAKWYVAEFGEYPLGEAPTHPSVWEQFKRATEAAAA